MLVALGLMVSIQVLQEWKLTHAAWMQVVGVEIFWPW